MCYCTGKNVDIVCIKVGYIYRPPYNIDDDFPSKLENKLTALNPNNFTFILCGDFNYDLFKIFHDHRAVIFDEHAGSISFIPTIYKPTRIMDQIFSLIDIILVKVIMSPYFSYLCNLYNGFYAINFICLESLDCNDAI